jgi:hypothetical protein
MPRRGANGKCQVCRHAERHRIELLLAGGARPRPIGERFGLHWSAIRRHWIGHVDDERKASLIAGPDIKIADLRERAAEEGMSLLDHYKVVRAALYRMLDVAQAVGDRNAVALVSGRLHENFAAVGRLTGELSTIGTVNLNVANFFSTPHFAALQTELVAALRDFPEARSAVLSAFRRLEAPPIDAAA